MSSVLEGLDSSVYVEGLGGGSHAAGEITAVSPGSLAAANVMNGNVVGQPFTATAVNKSFHSPAELNSSRIRTRRAS